VSNSAYSDLKPAWHLKDMQRLRDGEQITPHQVHFIISDLCNHDCHFCAYRMSGGMSTEQFADDAGNKNPNRRIPTEKCMEILNDMDLMGVKAVQFTGGGEPTVHKDHLKIFAYAQVLGLQTALVTNGCTLKPGWESILPRMKWIRVSVDAGRAQTYGDVRRIDPKNYEKVMGNIAKIRKAIDDLGSDCLLGAGYVVTKENWREILVGCRNLKEAGVPYVRLAGMFSEAGASYYSGIYQAIREVISEARSILEDDSFKVVDLFGNRISDLKLGAPDYEFCSYQQFVVYIGGNQKVYRCCTTSYTRHGEVGDLTNQRFIDWFQSPDKKYLYESFDARTCHVCQFNGKNKAVNYMLDPKPTHVEFV